MEQRRLDGLISRKTAGSIPAPAFLLTSLLYYEIASIVGVVEKERGDETCLYLWLAGGRQIDGRQ